MLKVTYSVNCPRDFGKVYKMTISVIKLKDGSYLPSPCNGCEELNGSHVCTRCIESLFKMSLKDPTMQSYSQPITPMLKTQ
jgi:hypothetical protein